MNVLWIVFWPTLEAKEKQMSFSDASFQTRNAIYFSFDINHSIYENTETNKK